MSIRKVPFATGEYYHIFNRGVEKRELFLDTEDWQRFQSLLYLCNSGSPIHRSDYRKKKASEFFQLERDGQLVDIGAYMIMPNHFHLLLHEFSEGGISTFMHRLGTSYAMYFNQKYERTGPLFAGKFKSVHAMNDTYLKYLYAYIHLNPIRKYLGKQSLRNEELVKKLKQLTHGSMPDYLGTQRAEQKILTPSAFPEYFESPIDHLNELRDWFSSSEDRISSAVTLPA